VEAQSAGPGQGSEFSVRLPAHPRVTHRKDRANASSRPALARKSLRILAVDDNTDAADTFAELLPLWGHQVQVAYTGPEALARAREYRPDLVLLDIGLPGMDGYTVARQIRKDPSLASIRLVAVTGFGQDADRRQAQDAGFDDYLTKPVDPDELRRLLESMQLVR
jgi:CheY-like chemotaxis protein